MSEEINNNEAILPTELRDVMTNNYIAYAQETLKERAIPDVRDGLKPVHLRILYSMEELGLDHKAKYKKSARVVGDVLGKYHPHGEGSVYQALINKGQTWTMRYPIIDIRGNSGSVDGDPAAAMRYTEARLSEYGEALLKDINKNTVDFTTNFDDTLKEPTVLPSLIPNFLANGTDGIACGFATDVPPHNLTELYNACIFMIDRTLKDQSYEAKELMKYIKGPDFPTGGIITNTKELKKAFETGRGKVTVKARYEVETDSKQRSKMTITELPYRVNKLKLIEKIESLVESGELEGIKEIIDSSKGDDIRIIINFKKGVDPTLVINNLLNKTDLKKNISYNIIALENKAILNDANILDCLNSFLFHCVNVIRRRSQFDLDKMQYRMMMLEAIFAALSNLDEFINVVRTSEQPVQAIMELLDLTEEQAKYLYDMRISVLSNQNETKLRSEYAKLEEEVPVLQAIITNDQACLTRLKVEMTELRDKFGDERKTEIALEEEITDEDLIKNENLIVTITSEGNIKSVLESEYNTQKRNGKGNKGADTKDDEIITDLFTVQSKDDLLFITNKGKVHHIKAYMLPKTSRIAKGKNIANYLTLEKDEYPVKTVATKLAENTESSLMLLTDHGQIKKLSLSLLSKKKKYTTVIGLKDDHKLVDANLVTEDDEILLGTANGQALRFNSSLVKNTGRTAMGVIGIKLAEGDSAVSLVKITKDCDILSITELGLAKRTQESKYPVKGRATRGVQSHKISDKTGKVVAYIPVVNENILIGTNNGKIIRLYADTLPQSNRNTTGNKAIKLDKDDTVATATLAPNTDLEDN
jgi:DNA gyrase subunit A